MAKIEPLPPATNGEPRWRVKWIVGYHDNGKPKYKSRSTRSHREAVQLRAERELAEAPKRHNFKPRYKQSPKLETVAEAYLEALENPPIGEDKAALSTRKQAHSIIANHVLVPELKTERLKDIGPDAYRIIYQRCEALGVGASTRNHALRLLKCVLKFGVTAGHIPFAPDNPIKNKTTKKEQRLAAEASENKFYTPNEIFTMLAAADALAMEENKQVRRTWARYRPMVYFLTYTGARISEARAFRRQDYCPTEGRVYIVESAPEGDDDDTSTKTASGRRWVPLNPELADVLEPWLEAHDRKLVFGTKTDNYISLTTLYPRLLRPLKDKADALAEEGSHPRYVRVSRDRTFHGFRHHFAAWLIKEGANLKQLSSYMGHAKVSFTIDAYGHLFEDDGQELATKMTMRRSA